MGWLIGGIFAFIALAHMAYNHQRCPFCTKNINKKAIKCPYCTADLRQHLD
jgi:hypothetical protein